MNQVQEDKTWQIKDSSKLTTYLECPRKYFYEYILGWRIDKPEHDLWFGECWHMAREHQLINGYSDISGAYRAFINHYRTEFPPETDDIYRPKDPIAVAFALEKFALERSSDLEENELLYTEVSGTVPVDDKRVLHYRMDSILRNRETGKIFSWDHKSAKRFSNSWSNKFYLSLQNGTYTHCLYCMYPIEEVIGVEFCGTSFNYAKRAQTYTIGFERVPAWKTPEQMSVWLWSTLIILDNIERETDKLLHCQESDQVLTAFPMNPTSCSNYWGCKFHDYCISWSNPIRYCAEPPLGFKTSFWDPSAMETTNKMDLDLGELS